MAGVYSSWKNQDARDGAYDRHHNIADDRVDNFTKSCANNEANGQIDNIAAKDETLEVIQHNLLPFCEGSATLDWQGKCPGQNNLAIKPDVAHMDQFVLEGFAIILLAPDRDRLRHCDKFEFAFEQPSDCMKRFFQQNGALRQRKFLKSQAIKTTMSSH